MNDDNKYIENIMNAKTEKELFEIWSNKKPIKYGYIKGKKEIEVEIDYQKKHFVSDGIINPTVWYEETAKKRILFIIKEIYNGDKNKSFSLTECLRNCNKPEYSWAKSSMWARIAEWTYGIQNTSKNNLAKYDAEQIAELYKSLYDQISVVVIKKSLSDKVSNAEVIDIYTSENKNEIKRHIEIIDPEIIVCLNTISQLDNIFEKSILSYANYNENNFYFSSICGGNRLVIDYCAALNKYPTLLNFYGIVGIYYQALQQAGLEQ